MRPNITNLEGKIHGVKFRQCTTFPDNRGSFTEVFRSEWPKEVNYTDQIQLNLSRSSMGSMRGLHFHHKQSDWWILISGDMQVVLADLRVGSPTFMKSMWFTMSWKDSISLLIPPGIAHGFLAIKDVSLMYAVNRYYDGSDEQGVAWNDPDLNIQWDASDPIRSARDKNNPTVKQLDSEGLLPEFKE